MLESFLVGGRQELERGERSPTASRSPTAASGGRPRSRCSTGSPGGARPARAAAAGGGAADAHRRRRRRTDRRLGRAWPPASGSAPTVDGVRRSPEALRRRAASAGVLDTGRRTLAEAVAGAEAVFVAVPVGALPEAVGAGAGRAPERLRRHRRRLDEARGRRRPCRSAVRRRASARRRRDLRGRARPRRPVRRRDLVSDSDRRHVGRALRAAVPAAAPPRRATGGDRRRTPTTRFWPPSRTFRTCWPTCSSRRPPGRSPRAVSGCRPPGRAFVTPPAWPAPRAPSGPTSTCPTAMRWRRAR